MAASVALSLWAAGCTPDFDALDRGGADGGGLDAGELLDSGRGDAGGPSDAALTDGSATDARVVDAAGADGSAVDARVEPDACVVGAEACDGADQDCDGRIDEGSSCASGTSCREGACRVAPGTLLWGRVLASQPVTPTRARDRGRAVTSLGAAGVAIVGDYEEGPLSVDGSFLRAPAASDAFLVALDRDGNFSNGLAIGGGGFDEGLSVATRSGTIAAGGTVVGTVDFGGGDTSGGTSGFTARYGSPPRVANFMNAARVAGVAAALGLAPLGTGFVSAGRFGGTFDAGAPCTTATAASGSTNGFLVRYDASSVPSWCAILGGSSGSQVNAVAVNAAGDRVAVIGGFIGAATFAGTDYTAADLDTFVVVFDASGVELWATTVSGASPQEGSGIAFLPSGDLVIAGGYVGATSDVAGMTLPNSPFQRAYVARIDGTTHLATWVRVDTGGAGSIVRGVATAGDAIVLHGQHNGVRFTGCPAVPVFGGQDLFVSRLSSDGTCVWVQSVGGPGAELAGGIAADADRVYVAASVDDGAIIDGSTVTTLGDDASGRDTDAVLLAFEL